MKQQGEAASKTEARPNPGRGGRDLRERKADSNCVACCKDKKRGVPPKTRWKEEQKEKARNQEAQGKENRIVAVPGPGRIIAATGSEGSEARQAPEEAQKDTAAIPGPEEVTATTGSEGGKIRQTPEGVQENTKDPKKEDAQAPVACVTGVPRGPVSRGELARVAPPGDRSSPEALEEINQQYLHSKYNFKEGAPLKEYLRQRIPNFRETCTLSEVLTWLKEIIRDHLLFDEGNPAMIVGDAPLETALRKKRVHVNEIRSVVQRQLTIVEARRGPMSAAMLAEGLAQMGRVSVIPRPAVRAVAAPDRGASRTSCAVQPSPWNLAGHRHGVLHTSPTTHGMTECGGSSSGSHISRGKLHGSAGASIDPRTKNLQGSPSQQGSSGKHQPGHCDVDVATGQRRVDQWIHGVQLRRHEKPHGRVRANPANRMLDEAANAGDSDAQRWKNRVDAGQGLISCRPLQDDGDSDASELRLKRRNRALEDDHDRKADPDQSPGLHGNIRLRKGDPV